MYTWTFNSAVKMRCRQAVMVSTPLPVPLFHDHRRDGATGPHYSFFNFLLLYFLEEFKAKSHGQFIRLEDLLENSCPKNLV